MSERMFQCAAASVCRWHARNDCEEAHPHDRRDSCSDSCEYAEVDEGQPTTCVEVETSMLDT